MPPRAKTICNKSGCNKLVDGPGYCDIHKDKESPFTQLNRKKTSAMKKFYSSSQWTKTSKMHRKRYPLCGRCKDRGTIQKAEMVHHEPSLNELIKMGLNPLHSKYLHSLCNNCHLEDLREKRNI